MKILVIGGGGREHALAWKIRQSRSVEELFCSPGNAGIAEIADCPPLASSDPEAVADFVARQGIDLTVVGPELPLAEGIADRILSRGRAVFGPTAGAARLESSKAFAKEFMTRHKIPTAPYEVFSNADAATAYIERCEIPIVIKADGLAGGKGVVVATTRDEAREAVHKLMIQRAFGGAGRTVVIERFLHGREASFFAISDGRNVIPLVTCQDYKRVHDGDRGPNTGGMGAYSPALHLDRAMTSLVLEKIVCPTIQGIAAEGFPYRGCLYVGLMLTDSGPYVIEYNVRFGDPETQVLMPRMASDLVPMLMAAAHGDISNIRVEWRREAAVTVVLTAGGYPGTYPKGKKINGLELFAGSNELMFFHAGTRTGPGGEIRTAGGRVLAITALGRDIQDARRRVYDAAAKIHFPGVHYRRDIGSDAVLASTTTTPAGARR
jgi:phosphoribosylamine--glycine ligase